MDYLKIGIMSIMGIILLIGIGKSLRIKKIGYFLVALLIDIIMVIGFICLDKENEKKDKIKDDEQTMNETVNKNNEDSKENETTSKVSSTTKNTTSKVNDNSNKVSKTSKGYEIKEVDGVTYVDGYMIVNKTYSLPSDYVPKNTHTEAGSQKYCQTCIVNEAWDEFNIMKADATALGLNIWIQSGYRSYKAQEGLYNNYVNRDGKTAADTYSARAGHSEHQTGYAFDLNTITDAFQYTDEGKWINENAYKYGFIIRYPKGKDDITGYKYESWHLRYVGKELADKLYNNGDWITMEEYFGIESQYAN